MNTPKYLIVFGTDPETGLDSISPFRVLSDAEFDSYQQAVEYLLEFRQSEEVLPMVAGNLLEYSRLSKRVVASPEPQEWSKDERLRIAREVNRELVNFLGATRLYLDHLQTRISRRYGHESPPLVAFKKATATAFDTEPAYRVLYKMRNFIQHCGMPIRMVAVNSRLEYTPDGPSITEVVIDCDSADLLERYDSWGAAKRDLEALGPKLDLDDLSIRMLAELQKIDRCVREAETPYLLAAGGAIMNLLCEVLSEETTAAVGEVESDGKYHNLRIMEPPMDMLERLGFVRLSPDAE